jgi:hypothetical protein
VDVEGPRRSATDFKKTGSITIMATVTLSKKQREELLRGLQSRFEKHMNRHKSLEWAQLQAKLEAKAEKLWSLHQMETTGGEPDAVGQDKETEEYIFYDCSAESPQVRRSLCYDREALDSRKENKPKGSALEMAASMGVEILTEEQYRDLQKLGKFDCKTSSWVNTPSYIRRLGGARGISRGNGPTIACSKIRREISYRCWKRLDPASHTLLRSEKARDWSCT